MKESTGNLLEPGGGRGGGVRTEILNNQEAREVQNRSKS